MTMYSLQNIKLILINSKDLPFMHALNKEMLLLKSSRVIFKKKALESWVSCVTCIGGQYRGTKVPRYWYRGTFLVPVPVP